VPRIAYLGPEGTFTEAALLKISASGLVPGTGSSEAITPIPTESTPAALAAVRSGDADYACVPIENSIEGSVLPTLDNLAAGAPLQIFAELTLDVSFTIVVRRGTPASEVDTVAAFPVAAAQVRHWLTEHLPKAQVVPANSNAAAAHDVSNGRADAGVSTALAAARYGLTVLATDVVDEPNARTRFVLAGQPGPPPVLTKRGADILVQVEKMLDEAAKTAGDPIKPVKPVSSNPVAFPDSFAAAAPGNPAAPVARKN